MKKNFKCRCGKSYKNGQGLRQHRLTHDPPLDSPLSTTSLTKSVKASSLANTTISVAHALSNLVSSAANSSASTVLSHAAAAPLLASPLGVSIANGSIVLESITPISTGGLLLESRTPTASAALGSIASAAQQATGLIVTLPSGVEPTSANLAQASLAAAAKKFKYKQIQIQAQSKD